MLLPSERYKALTLAIGFLSYPSRRLMAKKLLRLQLKITNQLTQKKY